MNAMFASIRCGLMFLLVLPLSTACRSTSKEERPEAPGRPEVEIRAPAATTIVEVSREFFLERGYVETASPLAHELVMDRPLQPESARRALRVRIRLLHRGGDRWRVTADPLGVERWRTELESETVLPAGFDQMRQFLQTIRDRVEQGGSFSLAPSMAGSFTSAES